MPKLRHATRPLKNVTDFRGAISGMRGRIFGKANACFVTQDKARLALDQLVKIELYQKLTIRGKLTASISKIKMCSPKKHKTEQEDYCIVLYLQERLPRGKKFPNMHSGVRVFPKYVGPVRALKK